MAEPSEKPRPFGPISRYAVKRLRIRSFGSPEIWFDWLFSRLTCDSALPPFADALPPYEPPSAPSPTTCEGPPLPPVALPPAPPNVLVVWVLVAVLLWWHCSPNVLPVASRLQMAELL